MKLAPVFWKVDCAPATGYLGQVWGAGVQDTIGGEKRPSIEGPPAFWSELDHFLLIKTDAKHRRRDIFGSTIPVSQDRHLDPRKEQGRHLDVILEK